MKSEQKTTNAVGWPVVGEHGILQLTAHCSLLTVHCSLFTAHYFALLIYLGPETKNIFSREVKIACPGAQARRASWSLS